MSSARAAEQHPELDHDDPTEISGWTLDLEIDPDTAGLAIAATRAGLPRFQFHLANGCLFAEP